MEALIGLNPAYLDYLRPLLKWRILDQRTLWEESKIPKTYGGFNKLIKKWELYKIIDSNIIPWTRKKYISLSSTGEKIFGVGERTLSINRENVFHDAQLYCSVKIVGRYAANF
jgi:hypothetical protein